MTSFACVLAGAAMICTAQPTPCQVATRHAELLGHAILLQGLDIKSRTKASPEEWQEWHEANLAMYRACR